MIYLVSNIHRSGSSMMMQCLQKGGMDVIYDESQDSMNAIYGRGDYLPNPNGFYRPNVDFERKDFHLEYDEKVMKCPIRSLLTLPLSQYRLILLKRNPKEIKASMQKFNPIGWGFEAALEFYGMYFDALIRQLRERGDMDILVLNYADIVANPLVEFSKIASAGWTIDVEVSASMVDSSLYRFRLETK